MEARVQILPLDVPNANNRVYPKAVIQDALTRLNGQSLAVTHVKAFLSENGSPKVSDSIGVASGLAIDEVTNMLMANVKVDVIPPDLQNGYVFRSAGFGKLEGNTVTEFTLSAVVIGNE